MITSSINSSDSSILPRILLGVAAGAALGFGASEASAAVVITDPTDLTVAPLSYIYFDPQTGYAGAAPAEGTGIDAPFTLGFYGGNSAKPEIVTTSLAGYQPGQAFANAAGFAPEIAVGTTISASTGTLTAVGTTTYLHNTSTTTTYPWAEGNHGFLAFAVPSNGSAGSAAAGATLYGWAEVSYNTANTLTLYRFGYDNSGAAITTPALAAVPEPGSLAAAAALGAAGLLAYRRRRARAQRGESSEAAAAQA